MYLYMFVRAHDRELESERERPDRGRMYIVGMGEHIYPDFDANTNSKSSWTGECGKCNDNRVWRVPDSALDVSVSYITAAWEALSSTSRPAATAASSGRARSG